MKHDNKLIRNKNIVSKKQAKTVYLQASSHHKVIIGVSHSKQLIEIFETRLIRVKGNNGMKYQKVNSQNSY